MFPQNLIASSHSAFSDYDSAATFKLMICLWQCGLVERHESNEFLGHATNWSRAPTLHYSGGMVCAWVAGVLDQVVRACPDISPSRPLSK